MIKPGYLGVHLTLIGALVFQGALGAPNARIAILDFELKDLTVIGETPEETERTASVAPLLRQNLLELGDYELVEIDSEAQRTADKGVGYLFDHPQEAADLAAQHGADWVVVGRVHKPSFLFAYLKLHLVRVSAGAPQREYVVEVKGPSMQATARGTRRLAEGIAEALSAAGAR